MKRIIAGILLFMPLTSLAMMEKVEIKLQGRSTLTATLAPVFVKKALAAYDLVMKTIPSACVQNSVYYANAYQALNDSLPSILCSGQKAEFIFTPLVNECDRPEIFARHLINVYHSIQKKSQSFDLGQILYKFLCEYLAYFDESSKARIFVALAKMNPPKALTREFQNVFGLTGLSEITLALQDESQTPFIKAIYTRILKRITRIIRQMRGGRVIEGPSRDLTLEMKIRIEYLLHFPDNDRGAFPVEVRQIFNQLDTPSKYEFLKHLVTFYGSTKMHYADKIHEIFSILFYGGLVIKLKQFRDQDLLNTISLLLKVNQAFVLDFPETQLLLKSYAEVIDPRTKMLKYLVSGISSCISELCFRVINSPNILAYDIIKKSLLDTLPQFLKETVFSQMISSTKMYDVIALSVEQKEHYFKQLITIFLPYFVDTGDNFSFFFEYFNSALDYSQVKMHTIELIQKKLATLNLENEKVQQFHEYMAFSF